MAKPLDLQLDRHGQSEGNVASAASKKGDDSHYTEEFLNRHSSKWRLTDQGIWEAQSAGAWIRAEFGWEFDRYYVSEYLRAKETAANLKLPEARWYPEFYLRERDWGALDVMTHAKRMEIYADAMRRREIDAFYWSPVDGESMAQLCLRIDRVIETLHRECEGKRVIIVCHGEVMWAFRMRLERMSQARYHELDVSRDPCDRIHNCQVLHYSRRDPETGEVAPYLGWMRSSCPWDLSLSRHVWTPIERRAYANEDLLLDCESFPRLVNV
jgi:NAD+ kinase